MFSLQNSSTALKVRIWFVTGLCKLVCAIFFFTVPPIPSQGDLPWLMAKNNQTAWNSKSFTWLHKFIRFLRFLYWPVQPSLQYAICLIWGNVSWRKLHNDLWISWTKLVYHDPGRQRECRFICEPADFTDSYNGSPQDERCTDLFSNGIFELYPA